MTTPPIQATFALVDHHGDAVSERTHRGSWQLVQFGFTSCKVVCPRALTKLSAALEALDQIVASAPLVPLYISVDPDRDSPAAMKAFLERSYPRFTGLTGTAQQVDEAKRAFRVFTRRRAAEDGYDVQHTAITYLLDPDGRPAHYWPDTHTAPTITADLVRLLDHHTRSGLPQPAGFGCAAKPLRRGGRP